MLENGLRRKQNNSLFKEGLKDVENENSEDIMKNCDP